jgi:hypothetical protein
MARTAQISKEKLKFPQEQSQKPSSAIMKLSVMRNSTGKEDPELPLLQRISSFKFPASNCSPNKCFTEFK